MGAHPYWYSVKYQPDVDAALEELREREFQAGRYNPVMMFPPFPITPQSPAPGPQHSSIAEAFVAADADGTRSILDIASIGDAPDFGTAGPLDDGVLESLYGTTKPTLAMVESNMDFLEDVERGQAVYIICYTDDVATDLVFAGYSFD
jgi:hypothetical protein